jgi:hypothetical protein
MIVGMYQLMHKRNRRIIEIHESEIIAVRHYVYRKDKDKKSMIEDKDKGKTRPIDDFRLLNSQP